MNAKPKTAKPSKRITCSMCGRAIHVTRGSAFVEWWTPGGKYVAHAECLDANEHIGELVTIPTLAR